jgi:lipase maturation factor 1
MASGFSIGRWLFLRALAVVYLIAFVSLWIQVPGLIGPHGILPAQDYLDLVRGQVGWERFYYLPTVFWFGAGTRALTLVCGLGTFCSVMLLVDVWPRGTLLALWALYLSLVSVGQDFLSFQWDALLLESGLLALFLAPGYVLPRKRLEVSPQPIAIILLWGLLFRLVFESGAVKLTSGDPTWRDLSALDYHFWTQPLATWTAWYANLLPEGFKHFSVAAALTIELGAPLLIWCGRWPRAVAFTAIVGLQLLIFASGNYTFFNLLTIGLAFLLLDDQAWRRVLPEWLLWPATPLLEERPSRTTVLVTAGLGAPLLALQLVSLMETVGPKPILPRAALQALAYVSPLNSLNGYGLFRVMTTTRPEIIVEGSDDGTTWKAYEFRYKPGALDRRPGFVEPHQPRLDWQMWFAALDRFGNTPWFASFMERLLEGDSDVLALLGSNPFPGHPPTYLRATLYEYRFTDGPTRMQTGDWWTRRELGPYSPVIRLEDFGPREPSW